MQAIAHNLSSQFTNRQLNITTGKKVKLAEKLATGYRINRSAEDAAGLQISEKMRWQIKGLNKASNNIQDGISLIQVADGALEETHAVLQRMRELSVQAANDTNTETDRNAIQDEMDALTREIDRIAEDTSFNGEIYPISSKQGKLSFNFEVKEIEVSTHVWTSDPAYVDGKKFSRGESVTLTALTVSDRGEFFYENMGNGCYNGAASNGLSGYNHTSTTGAYSLYLRDLKVDDDGYVYFEPKGAYTGKRYIVVQDDGGGNVSLLNGTSNKNDASVDNAMNFYLKGASIAGELWLQMGAEAQQGMFINLVDATANGMGIKDPPLEVTNYQKAGDAIVRLDDAIAKVSEYRSTFGAQQNRLEHAMSVVDNTSENTQVAESRIRDTDMAKEMVELSKHNILEQAGQAMLAQANQSQHGILQLLQ